MWDDLFNKYCSKFRKQGEKILIGPEKEFPVVRQDDFTAFDLRQIFPTLIEMGGTPEYDPYYKDVVLGVEYNGVNISTDAGWGTLEFSSLPSKTILEAEKKFLDTMGFCKSLIEPLGGIIIGYGVQPRQPLDKKNWIKKRRHEVVCRNFGCGYDTNITLTASDQVHLSVTVEEAARVSRIFNMLAGPIIALFANSPIIFNRRDARLAPREFMWWFTPQNRHGIFPKETVSLREYFDFTTKYRHLVSMNCRDYIVPGMSFRQWIEEEAGPEAFWDELPTLEGTTWTNARVKATYGTVEIRPACQQPKEAAMALPAFTLGLYSEIDEVERIFDSWGVEYADASEIREIAMSHGLKAEFSNCNQKINLTEMCSRLLEICEQGLLRRGLGEEKYLSALWSRVRSETTIAEECIALFEREGMAALIERVAY
jgi:gamma-glutamylcysteine synthetase